MIIISVDNLLYQRILIVVVGTEVILNQYGKF